MAPIPLIYRLYFIYIDPALALYGSILVLTNPALFLQSTTPPTLTEAATVSTTTGPLNPLTTLLLTQISALYAFFAITEGLVLYQTKQLRVWRSVLLGVLVCDIGHGYAVLNADAAAWDLRGWRAVDAINYGILIFGAGLRGSFLLGVGLRAA
ncbi:hypothetical protein BP5796_09504 [Coleophoma crateriformis]|uniref:DUF7704 domain-containing protein n=1 Tax=Coleophoma crateriformis TaxID=565419 RepID=A0A3D8QYB8_9HELO|nr:hypothetical protein BP5796_09504 [Coleophoma crateriformis]